MKKEALIIIAVLFISAMLIVSGCNELNMVCKDDECQPTAKEDQKTLEPFIVEETRPTEPGAPS